MAAAVLAWIALLIQRKRRFEVPGFFWPLVGYAGLSLVASAFSVNPAMSFKDSRELTLFLIVPVTMAALGRKVDLKIALGAMLISSSINTLHALGYQILRAEPGERVEGFMAHYMTQAGILALFGAFALGMIFLGRGRIRIAWSAGFVLAAAALFLTYTRSSWIGLAVGLSVVILFWKPKALLLVPILAGLAFVAAPRPLKDRVIGVFTTRNISNTARVQYAKAGLKIIRDYPLFGTGPDTVDMVFQNPKYGLGEFAKRNVHLHSNIIQIAAERGPLALAAWLAFVGMAAAGLWRLAKFQKGGREAADPARAVAAGSIAALAAFFVAGFFEYNFGDSEITTLLLIVLALPFSASKIFAERNLPPRKTQTAERHEETRQRVSISEGTRSGGREHV
jgi:O-antigen ligase